MNRYGNYIDGREDFEGDEVSLHSPADGSAIASVVFANSKKTKEAIDAASDAFRGWSHTSLEVRQSFLLKLAERIQSRAEEYSFLEAANTGKTIRQSTLMDIPLGIEHLNYFATMKEFTSSREISHPEFPGSRGIIQYEPLGVVGAIAPWNVPFLMAIWKLAPALLAGNTVVLKPSHHTPLTALELAKDSQAVDFPRGVVNILTGNGPEVGQALVTSPKVNMISFTGSTATGERLLSSSVGLKKFTLELGGKSPNIVFEDADLEKAVKGVLFGIYLNSGQLCESGSRLIVQSSIKERFLSKCRELMEKMRAGNPLEMETDIGAITTSAQKKKIDTMVEDGISRGAQVYYERSISGSVPRGGLYCDPILMTKVSGDMEIAREEIFGPVLVTQEFETEDEAVQVANNTEYGLAAGVWSNDLERAKKVAGRIDAGTVWINDYHLLSAAAPRGGFKKSGIGRELGLEGLMEFTQTRHIFVNEGSDIDEVAYGLVFPE